MLSKWEFLRRVLVFIWIKINDSEVFLRSASLTYVTMFSVVPFLAFSTSILKGLGGYKFVKNHIYEFARYFFYGNETIMNTIDKVFFYVEKTNFTTLGVLGAFTLIWAVVSMFSNVENALSKIWLVNRRRPWLRRIIDYTAMSVLFPIAINTFVLSIAFVKDTFLAVILNIIPLFMLVFTIFLLYQFIPLVEVDFTPNLIGAIFASFLWIFIQYLYYRLQVGLSGYNAIYGSFAALPLFMLAIYWSWFSFLLGAIISFTYANRYIFTGEFRYFNGHISPVERFVVALNVLRLLYDSFREGRGLSKRELIKKLKVPPVIFDPLMDDLKSKNFVVLSDDGKFYPAISEDRFSKENLLSLFIGPLSKGPFRILLEVEDGGKEGTGCC